MQQYVVGFMFDASMNRVVMIRKTKPKWQAGLLNGVGGKIEPGEHPLNAMTREFLEETGKATWPRQWTQFSILRGQNNDGSAFQVVCFYSREGYFDIQQMEEEKVDVFLVDDLVVRGHGTLANVPWLLAAARDFGLGVHPPHIIEVTYGNSSKVGCAACDRGDFQIGHHEDCPNKPA